MDFFSYNVKIFLFTLNILIFWIDQGPFLTLTEMQWTKLSVSTETKERCKLITSFRKLCDRNSWTLPNNPTYSSDQIVKEGRVQPRVA